jgi:hypothetical protein
VFDKISKNASFYRQTVNTVKIYVNSAERLFIGASGSPVPRHVGTASAEDEATAATTHAATTAAAHAATSRTSQRDGTAFEFKGLVHHFLFFHYKFEITT